MTRIAIKNGGVIRCDASNNIVEKLRCAGQFTSFSMVSLIRSQAKQAGWDRVPGWQVPDGHNGAGLHDVCPTHAVLAAERKARKEEVLAEQRAKKKADRDAAKNAERDAREKARADRLAKVAALAKRKEDHARRKAELLAAQQKKRDRRAAKRKASSS